MGHRLSQIYPRTGDEGTTGLGDGSRVSKDSLRIHALGDVDELNSVIGMLLIEELPGPTRALLTDVQHDLFDLGGELSIPGVTLLDSGGVARLERELDAMNDTLDPLKEFILPGGTRAAALTHLARAVCRRAERAVVALGAEEALNDTPRQYLNRLSDLMFVLARVLNRHRDDGLPGDDVYWRSERLRQGGAD